MVLQWICNPLMGVRFSQGAPITECSSVWLEYMLWEHGVVGSNPTTRTIYATVVQWIEQQPSKLWVAGSIPASRAIDFIELALVAQLVRAEDS